MELKMLTMGNGFAKYKHSISGFRNKDIVSARTMRGVEDVIDYLKLNAWNRQMFQMPGTQRRIKRVAGYIHAGGGQAMHKFFAQISLSEVARGLLYFLIRLSKPLLPLYIQTLALDAPNSIQSEIVASDILGLIKQDLNGLHLNLIILLLEFLSYIRKYRVHTELTESDIHIIMLPVFFSLQTQHLPEWRKVASIFMEMVSLTPTVLLNQPALDETFTDNVIIEHLPNVVNDANDLNILENHEEENILNMVFNNRNENVVVHHYRIRRGNEGDANPGEMIPLSLVRRARNQPLINNVFGYRRR